MHCHQVLIILCIVNFAIASNDSCDNSGNCSASTAGQWSEPDDLFHVSCRTWLFSLVASCIVGLSGILPLLILPPEFGLKLHGKESGNLKLLLSFAVGGLLGDVFLHLLPEAWDQLQTDSSLSSDEAHRFIGLWVLAGVFTFICIELIFSATQRDENEKEEEKEVLLPRNNKSNGKNSNNGYIKGDINQNEEKPMSNGKAQHHQSAAVSLQKKDTIQIAGYLNLVANSIDNFTHGLAVAGSFIVSFKMGLLTTAAILIHEIPHEVGDFAILIRSGFSRWQAAKAQLGTATIGVLGAIAALSAESLESVGKKTFWILPFTSGGFLNIALVSVLPDLLKEDNPRESIKQVLCIGAGVAIMALVQDVAH